MTRMICSNMLPPAQMDLLWSFSKRQCTRPCMNVNTERAPQIQQMKIYSNLFMSNSPFPRIVLPLSIFYSSSQTPKGSPKAIRSHRDPSLASAMAKLSVSSRQPPPVESQSPLSHKPVVISEPATLYLWDLEVEQFKCQGEVEACIIENGGRDCKHLLTVLVSVALTLIITTRWLDWLQARGRDAFASHQVGPELNPKFATVRLNFGNIHPDSLTVCVIFRLYTLCRGISSPLEGYSNHTA
jgi:hypothetical protein